MASRPGPGPALTVLVGAGCVGKTTLAAGVAAARPDATIVGEAARDWFRAHPTPEPDRFRFTAQAAIQAIALTREQHAAAVAAGPVVCDRSTLCAPVYVHAAGDPAGAAALYARIRGWAAGYRRVWLLDPAGVPYADDAVRAEGPAVRDRLHAAYVACFAAWGVPYRLLTGTPAARLGVVLADLRGDFPPAQPDGMITG